MVLGPLVQKMEIIAVYVVNPAHCLFELFFLQTLPLGSLASARRSFRYVVARHRQAHIRDELSGGIIRTQTNELHRKVDHVAFLLTAKADEILIDLHARSPVVVERTTHHAVPADFVSVMLSSLAGADLSLDLGIDPQSITFFLFGNEKTPVFIGKTDQKQTLLKARYSVVFSSAALRVLPAFWRSARPPFSDFSQACLGWIL